MKLTPTLGGAYSGSVGGLVASHNKGGAYLRRRSVPTDPASEFQVIIRAALGSLAQAWVNTLTEAQRVAWDTYAQNVSWIDSLGQTIQLSGINHFIRSNTPRVQTQSLNGAGFTEIGSLPTVLAAPSIFTLATAPVVTLASLTVDVGPPAETVLTVAVTPATAAVNVVNLWVSPPQNPSVKFFKGPYIMVDNVADDVVTSLTPNLLAATNPYFGRYGAIAIGQSVFVALRRTHDDGRLSSLTRFGPITAVAA